MLEVDTKFLSNDTVSYSNLIITQLNLMNLIFDIQLV